MKQGIIPQKDLQSVSQLADVFKTFATNLKYVTTYEDLAKACKTCDISLDHIESKYPDLKNLLKVK